ncbi:MAG: hypothetical protein WCO60_07525 [Verrucomicrobiota bacterium]
MIKFIKILFGAGFLSITGFALAEAPALSLEKAIVLAQEQLHVRHLEKNVFIQSISLNLVSMIGGERVWQVAWSENLEAGKGKLETGVEINMRGEVVRLVKRTGDVRKP